MVILEQTLDSAPSVSLQNCVAHVVLTGAEGLFTETFAHIRHLLRAMKAYHAGRQQKPADCGVLNFCPSSQLLVNICVGYVLNVRSFEIGRNIFVLILPVNWQ